MLHKGLLHCYPQHSVIPRFEPIASATKVPSRSIGTNSPSVSLYSTFSTQKFEQRVAILFKTGFSKNFLPTTFHIDNRMKTFSNFFKLFLRCIQISKRVHDHNNHSGLKWAKTGNVHSGFVKGISTREGGLPQKQ